MTGTFEELARRAEEANESLTRERIRLSELIRRSEQLWQGILSSRTETSFAHPQPDDRGADSVLTPREREVLRLIAAGQTSKEIAGTLGIAFKTAVCHRTHLMAKLGIHETAGLVRYAIRHGLVHI